MAVSIHATAIVEAGAQLGEDVSIGPYCVVGPHVALGDGVRLSSHVVVEGRTTIGANTRVFSFACLGGPPQHLKYADEPTRLVIGRDNMIREHVTMHPGTTAGRMLTTVGDRCYFMVGAHIAHDCVIGSSVLMANNATLGGHVEIGDHVIVGGLTAIHQFVRIGDHAFISGMAGVHKDVIPYGLVRGRPGRLRGLNLVGLKRRGFERHQIELLRLAFDMLFRNEGEFERRIEEVDASYGREPGVQHLLDFLRADSGRPVLQPRSSDDD